MDSGVVALCRRPARLRHFAAAIRQAVRTVYVRAGRRTCAYPPSLGVYAASATSSRSSAASWASMRAACTPRMTSQCHQRPAPAIDRPRISGAPPAPWRVSRLTPPRFSSHACRAHAPARTLPSAGTWSVSATVKAWEGSRCAHVCRTPGRRSVRQAAGDLSASFARIAGRAFPAGANAHASAPSPRRTTTRSIITGGGGRFVCGGGSCMRT